MKSMPIVKADNSSIAQAADMLRGGGIVAFPTETVYGLGADTFNEAALAQVYKLKDRPFDNPLIAHVLNTDQARRIVAQWDARCESLASRFWPGPLTLVVPKHEHVPQRASAGYPTIAVRSPAHDIARQLLASFGGPISAPSANRSGHVSPTRAQHVADDFSSLDLLILDGGACDIGIESTVLDLSADEPRILRPGSVSADSISEVLGAPVRVEDTRSQQASPGTALRHYAPRTSAEVIEHKDINTRLGQLIAEHGHQRFVVLSMGETVEGECVFIPMPAHPEQYAARLYESLRRADAAHASHILIERPGEEYAGPMWDAVRNRLSRITPIEKAPDQ